MEQFPNPSTDEQALGQEPQGLGPQESNQPGLNPQGQDLPDPLTTAALLLLPHGIGEQYLHLWQGNRSPPSAHGGKRKGLGSIIGKSNCPG
jgi:hypothetical protein